MEKLNKQWETFFPKGETICANGEDYPFHVLKRSDKKLMIFWNGGGACWNGYMCDPANSTNDMNKGMIYRSQPTAEYGNDPRTLNGAFDLDNPENPFKDDWSMVFIPYSTGDVHLGTKVTEYTKEDGTKYKINHKGRQNSMAVLDWIQENFTELDTVFVSGGSAGGLCSPFYAAEVQFRYPKVEVIHFAGGAAGYRLPMGQTEQWDVWGTFDDLPEWFDTTHYNRTNTRFVDLYYIAAAAFPNIKFHWFDSAYDRAQTGAITMLGHPQLMYYGLKENQKEFSKGIPNLRHYTNKGTFHTILRFEELYQFEIEGVRIVDWVRDIANGKEVRNVDSGTAHQSR